MTGLNFHWLKAAQKFFTPTGTEVPPALAKAGVEATINQASFAISEAAGKLARGEISSDEWFAVMLTETKNGHMAAAALARGGIDQMRPQDWKRVEAKVFQQWVGVPGKYPGMRAFKADIDRGRYGAKGALNGMVGQRAGQYPAAFRATYENERTDSHAEEGYGTATRIASTAVENCPTCAEEDGVQRTIDEVVEIGDSPCGSACHCTIIYDRS